MVHKQVLQTLKLAKSKIRRHGGLHTLLAINTNTHVGFLDHEHVVVAITNGECLFFFQPNESYQEGFLQRGATAAYHRHRPHG